VLTQINPKKTGTWKSYGKDRAWLSNNRIKTASFLWRFQRTSNE
jgi:hypothetical protein